MPSDDPPYEFHYCSGCGDLCELPRQRYCRACAAEWARAKRKKYKDWSPEAKRRHSVCRVSLYLARVGKIPWSPCEDCGEEEVELFHPNGYDDPYDVIWLCPRRYARLRERRQKG